MICQRLNAISPHIADTLKNPDLIDWVLALPSIYSSTQQTLRSEVFDWLMVQLGNSKLDLIGPY